MSIPPWARWALAVVLVLGIAAGGVAANLAVLGSTEDDTALGTLSAGSIAQQQAPGGPGPPVVPAAPGEAAGTPIPPAAVVDGPPANAPDGEAAEDGDGHRDEARGDDRDDDDRKDDDRDDD